MQSPPSLAGSCHILPRTTTPHTQTHSRLHPAPRCSHANPTGSSGAVTTANPMCNLGCVPKAWPAQGQSWASPQPAQPFPHPKNLLEERKEEGGPTAQRPHGTYGATCGKELGWCHAGLAPSLLQGGSIPPSKAAGCKLPDSNANPVGWLGGSPHHPPSHQPQAGRDQCITYLHPSRSLSRSHPVIHCSRCLRTWPRFQCIPGPHTVP